MVEKYTISREICTWFALWLPWHWSSTSKGILKNVGRIKTVCILYGKHFCSNWIPFATNYTWWRHQMETFSALLALCSGNSPVPVNSPHKGQWRAAWVFSSICAWINGWVNNRKAGDLRRNRAHYDVSVMSFFYIKRVTLNIRRSDEYVSIYVYGITATFYPHIYFLAVCSVSFIF